MAAVQGLIIEESRQCKLAENVEANRKKSVDWDESAAFLAVCFMCAVIGFLMFCVLAAMGMLIWKIWRDLCG